MGTCYCLQKIDKGEEYDLNKGHWPFPYDKPFYMTTTFEDADDLAIQMAVENRHWWDETTENWKKLAEHIWAWAADDRLMFYADTSDSMHDEECKDFNVHIKDRKFRGPYYRETGNRFQVFQPKVAEEYMVMTNKSREAMHKKYGEKK